VVPASTIHDLNSAEAPAEDARSGLAWKALGAVQRRRGGLLEAREAMRQAALRLPEDAEAQSNFGLVLDALDRPAEAAAQHVKAIALAPGFGGAYSNLGICLRKLGRPSEAVIQCGRGVVIAADNAEAQNALANAQREAGNFDAAETGYRRAVALSPGSSFAYGNQGAVLASRGRTADAVRAYRRAILLSPWDADPRGKMGSLLKDLGRTADGAGFLRSAMALSPQAADAYNNHGILSQILGAPQAAKRDFERALRLRPHFAECYNNFALLHRFRAGERPFSDLVRSFETARTPRDRMHLGFALGKAWEDVGDPDRAFACYRAANQLRRRDLAYDVERDRALGALVMDKFAGLPAIEPIETGRARPLMIVGMTRSGSSLVEQILASHSAVHGAGELEILPELAARRFLSHPDDDLSGTCRQIAAAYGAGIDALNPGRPVIIDKMPRNFFWLGFVLHARPDLKVIHTIRDPRAVCWSNYRGYFSPPSMGYAYDLRDLALYYRLHDRMMGFWKDLFPGRIYSLFYEGLTESQEQETRALLDFCGLPFEAACLDFQKTERPVTTASAGQVRRTMYQGSSDAWKPFARHLEPLLTALGLPEDHPWHGVLPP